MNRIVIQQPDDSLLKRYFSREENFGRVGLEPDEELPAGIKDAIIDCRLALYGEASQEERLEIIRRLALVPCDDADIPRKLEYLFRFLRRYLGKDYRIFGAAIMWSALEYHFSNLPAKRLA